VGVERPALHHFALAAGGVSLASTGTASGSGTAASAPAHRGSPRSLWPVAAVAVLLSLGAILTFRRRTTLRLRRRARLAAAPLAGSLVMIALLAATQGAGATVAPVSHPAPPVALRTAVTVVHRMPTQAEALWSRLTGIEATVGQNQAQLVVLSSLATQTAADNASVSPPRGGPSVVKDPQDARTQVAAAYQSALQTEYDFFVGTVRDDGQRQALIAAAQAAPAPIRDAVVYDVAAVQAELAQEAAIAAAQQAIPAAIGPAPKSLATPLSGAISQPFGPSSFGFEPQMTFNGVTYPHFHTGIDIAAPLDTPVHAAADGIVVLAGPSTDAAGHLVGYGNYVVIAHAGKMITLYGHLDQLLVHAGQPVHAGDVIGLEGSTGYSTGPHLHFEVRVGGLLTDPLPFLAAQLHHQ
jgi:murein DD-endopeptidase MepM/ murein hydrolase activator NlpD